MDNKFERIGEADYIISPLKKRTGAVYLNNHQIRWEQEKKSNAFLNFLSSLGVVKQIDYSFLINFDEVKEFHYFDFKTFRSWEFNIEDEQAVTMILKDEGNQYIRFYEHYVRNQTS